MSAEKTEEESSHSEMYGGYEKQDVNIPFIVAFAVICIVTVVIAVCALDGYFIYSKEKLNQEVNRVDLKGLNQLRAEENEILTNYGVLDKEKGVYKIPVKRAMQLLSEEAIISKDADQRK